MDPELEQLLLMASQPMGQPSGDVPNTDFASNMSVPGGGLEADLAAFVGGQSKPNPYGPSGSVLLDQAAASQGQIGAGAPHVEANPSQTGGSKSDRVKVKTSGPNGEVRGNQDPYSYFPTGNAKQRQEQARAGVFGSTLSAGQAMDGAIQGATDAAEVDKKRLMDESVAAASQAATISVAAKDNEARIAKSTEMKADATNRARERITQWNAEAKAASETEVDPSRYWNNRSGFQKVMFALGAMAGAGVQHIYGKNAAMDMLNQAIERDLQSQNDKMARKAKYLSDKRENIGLLNSLDRLDAEDFDQETLSILKNVEIKLSVVDKEIDAKIKKWGAERVNPELMQFKSQIQEKKAMLQGTMFQHFGQEAWNEVQMENSNKEAAKSRSAQFALQKKSQEFEREMNDAKLKIAQAQAGGDVFSATQWGIPGKIRLKGTDAEKKATGEKLEQQAREYINLKTLHDIVSDEGMAQKLIAGQFKKSVLAELMIDKSGGITGTPSDKDMELIRDAIMGAGGGYGEVFRPGEAADTIARQIDMNKQNGNAYMEFHTEGVDGSVPTYDPEAIWRKPGEDNSKVAPEDYLAELSGKYGGSYQAPKDPLYEKPENAKEAANAKKFIDEMKAAGNVDALLEMQKHLNEMDPEFATSAKMKSNNLIEAVSDTKDYLGEAIYSLYEAKLPADKPREIKEILDDPLKSFNMGR